MKKLEHRVRILRLAMANVRNIAAEHAYLSYGWDFTRPTQIYALVNLRCNAHCLMCDMWREQHPAELPASVWVRFLDGLHALNPGFQLNISGGEPLMKRDLPEILEFCGHKHIIAGVCTNGSLLTERNIDRLLQAQLLNINISIDSLNPEIYQRMRGLPLARTRGNIERLAAARRRLNNSTAVILKPLVCTDNLQGLEDLVKFTQDLGLNGVNFQPIDTRTEGARTMSQVDLDALRKVIDRLLELKAAGAPILNPTTSLLQMPDFFRGVTPPRREGRPCVVALRSLVVYPDGSTHICGQLNNTLIGNIERDDAKKLWRSAETKKMRAQLVRCQKLCLATCVVRRSLKDYFHIARRLLAG